MSDDKSSNSVVASGVEMWPSPRKVRVDTHYIGFEGWFHGFGLALSKLDYSGQGSTHTIAIVEDSHGKMHEVETWQIQFLSPWR